MEAASILGIRRAHIWRRIWSGELPHVRDARRVFITHKALVEYADRSHETVPWTARRRAKVGS
jgi:hypothetical protein